MNSEDVYKITDEEIKTLVSNHKNLIVNKDWDMYLFTKKQNYISDRRMNIGLEYEYNSQMWDSIFEREWIVMEERLSAGLGVESDILNKFGDGFFKSQDELLAEVRELTNQLETMTYKDRQVTIYTYEDFNMLSNQGIFRDSHFILDPQRKWKKKIVELLASYGYSIIETFHIGGEKYVFVSKEGQE
jgi:hypothetical protein